MEVFPPTSTEKKTTPDVKKDKGIYCHLLRAEKMVTVLFIIAEV